MRIPGWPFDPNRGKPPLSNGLDPTCVVLHRTIGHWAGDYAVLIRDRVPSVHFLIGQGDGQKVQMVDTSIEANHCAGANSKAVGIEFSGQNGEPLTAWQLQAGSDLLRWLGTVHGIPLTYYDGARIYVDHAGFSGFLNHRNVAYPPNTSLQHDDYIPQSEFDRMVTPVEKPKPKEEDPMDRALFVNGRGWFLWNSATGYLLEMSEQEFDQIKSAIPVFRLENNSPTWARVQSLAPKGS